MKESVAIAKDAAAKKEFSPTRNGNSIQRVRNEPERQLGSLRGVIGNITRDGGTPSVESLSTELSVMPYSDSASALLALQQTHGNQYVQRVVTGIQAKLKVGQPGDIYEQEADRVADAVIRMPEPDVSNATRFGSIQRIQRACIECGDDELHRQLEEEKKEEELIQSKPIAEQITPFIQKQAEEEEELIQPKPISQQITLLMQKQVEEEEPIQTKQVGRRTSQASPRLEGQIRSLRGGGQLLSSPVRDFFEPRFGHDFTQVRVHADTRAAASARAVNARAFTVGRDIVFGAGYYTPETNEGRRLLAHELTHVVQQASDPVIRRDDDDEEEEVSNIDRLEHLLEDDQEDEAIALMGRMRRENPDDVEHVLLRTDLRNLAVSAFDNEEMYRAIRAMNGSLYEGLQWMFTEGTSWEYVRDVIPRDPGKARVRTDNSMKDHFINICNDEEMAEAVDLLQGTLLQKLRWMAAEGSNWDLVKTKLQDSTIPQTEKTDLYNHDSMKNFFVSVCNDEEMAEAVTLLGGTLLQKLPWMLAEGTNAELVYSVIGRSSTGELPVVSANRDVMDGLRSELSRSEFERVRQMLRGPLHGEEMERGAREEHYEQETATSPWELETFRWTTAYEIQYTRTELKVIVRIELTGETTTAAQRNLWIRGIQNRWNGHFHIENSRRLRVVFEPVFTSTNSHHTVEIHPGHGRENMTNWYITTTDDTAAHEFGHMVGLEDEYRLTRADYIRLIGTAPPPGPEPPGYTMPGLMTAGTGPVQGRHLRPFVAWLNSHRLPRERNYRLVAGP